MMRLCTLSTGFAFLLLSVGAAAPLQAEADPKGPYLLADAETGEVIEHFDAVRPWYPASTTKLMTIYTVFRAVLAGEIQLDSPVVYSANAAAQPASKMGFKPGATLTLDHALKIMMVKSANDIAVAVAEAVGGSVPGFAERMNAAARRLGMSRSHFVNPHGLPDPGQVTTARDMALVGRALLVEFPQHRDFYKIHAIEIGGKVLKNFNPLLERYPGANGMKTGFICASGYNLVASARRGEREVIVVVFGEYGGEERAEHAAALLDQGFQTDPRFTRTGTTLETVASGQAYTEPLDMRPFVCGEGKAQTAADSAGPQDRGVATANLTAADAEPVSRLGPPVYLGPPIQVSLIPAAKPPPKGQARPGTEGFVARIPRSRPPQATDPRPVEIMDAFAPLSSPSVGGAPPAKAIEFATGAPAPAPGT
ncbi:MAG: D-alanyl-D-alanine carboxypeptidase [Pseudomonadota bacterium]|nr:D-alanyl-D-alanine carboxypeptidase [Pseudomonadota bacterium]